MTLRTLRWAAPAVAVLAGAGLLGASPALAASADGGAPPAGATAILVVRTVPVIQGVRVSLDRRAFATGPHGVVKIVTVSGRHRIGVLPPRSQPAGTRVRFARWLDGLALTSREITLSPGTNREQAGFVVSHPIALRFIDPRSQPVPVSDVTRLTIGSSLGQRYTFPPATPPSSLPANRIVRNQSGLVPLAIRYSVREVVIGGSNVVYGGSQNFFVHSSGAWSVRVLLFPLRVDVADALFGFAIGSSVRLTLPDGSTRTVPLGPGHTATVTLLPRATYQLVAKGPGFGLSSPSTLSKPQVARLLLLSWIDVLAAVAFAILFVIGLPVLGGRIVRRQRGIRLPTWHVGRAQQQAALPAGPAEAGGDPANPAEAGGDPANPADTADLADAPVSAGAAGATAADSGRAT